MSSYPLGTPHAQLTKTSFDARNSPEMMDHKFRIMQLLRKFNDPARLDEPGISLAKLRSSGAEILKQTLGKIGKNSVVETPLYAIFGCNTFIGSTVYANHGYVPSPPPLSKKPGPAPHAASANNAETFNVTNN